MELIHLRWSCSEPSKVQDQYYKPVHFPGIFKKPNYVLSLQQNKTSAALCDRGLRPVAPCNRGLRPSALCKREVRIAAFCNRKLIFPPSVS